MRTPPSGANIPDPAAIRFTGTINPGGSEPCEKVLSLVRYLLPRE